MNRYLFALGAFFSAALAQLVLVAASHSSPQRFVSIFLIAVVATARYGGRRAGFLTIALSGLVLLSVGFRELRSDDLILLMSFAGVGTLGVVFAHHIGPWKATANDDATAMHRARPLALAIFVLAFILAAGLGQGLPLVPGVSTTFWPPAGIFVAALLTSPRSHWGGYVLAAAIAELICNDIWFHNPLPLALAYNAANALEAIAAAWLIGRFGGLPFRLGTLRQTVALVLLGGIVAPIVGATVIASIDATIDKRAFATTWPLIWLGDGTGLLVSIPLALTVFQTWRGRAAVRIPRLVEAIAVSVLLVAVSTSAFRGALPTAYLSLPLVLWASMRFHLQGVAVAIALLTLSSAAFGVPVEDGFAAEQFVDERARIVTIQTFLGVAAVCGLLTSTLSLQWQKGVRALNRINRELERRVEERSRDLRAKDELLQLALTGAHATAFTWDIPGNEVRRLSSIATTLAATGEHPETFETFLARVHPDDRPGFEQNLQKAIAGPGVEYRNEFRLIAPDESVHWVTEIGQVEFAADGKPLRLVGLVLDITERRKAERMVERAADEYRALFEGAGVGNTEIDLRSWQFVRVNQRFCDMVGYSADELLDGMTFLDITHPGDKARDISAVRRFLEDQAGGFTLEKRYVRKDGTLFWGHLNASLLRGSEDTSMRLLCSITDITERKLAEDKLWRTAAALEEADRRKNEFLATLAHELRNPLAPIRNALQILKLADADPKTRSWSQSVMERQVGQMTRLIDDLMDVSRISQGKIVLQNHRLEVANVIHQAIETSRPLIEQYGHQFAVEMPETPIFIIGDEARLCQVFANILNNAAKYTHPSGRIRLTVELRENEAAIVIEDDGIGIPAEMLPKVFDLFAQVDRSLEKAQSGLGIGLNIAKRMVEMHGGSIAVASDGPGLGAQFTVRLPLASETSEELHSAAPQAGLQANRRILVVDDNEDGANSFAAMFAILGNETKVARDGLQAVELAASFRPHLILMDIGMPKLNGYEACRRIRAEAWGKDIIIVAQTGWGQQEDKQRAYEAGFDFHMVKPINPAALADLLAHWQTQDRPRPDDWPR